MPSVDIENEDGTTREYIRPGRPARNVPIGSTVTQVGRGVIQKSNGQVSSPPTGNRKEDKS